MELNTRKKFSHYHLQYSSQIFNLKDETNIFLSQFHSDIVYIFHRDGFSKFHYNDKMKIWKELWVNSLPELHFNKVLYFSDKWLSNGNIFFALKTSHGINFYNYHDKELQSVLKSNDFEEDIFHDVYDWNKDRNIIKFGHFYPDKNQIGIFTKHKKYGIKLYTVMNDEFLNGRYPIWNFDSDLSLDVDISTDYYLTDVKRKGQFSIISYGKSGLNIYEFNKNYQLEHKHSVPNAAKLDDREEYIAFPNLTNQIQNDLVIVNASGLFVYQFDNTIKDYNILNYNSQFSEIHGWDPKYIKTINFYDIDSDGRDEIIYNGPYGLDVLFVDNALSKWQTLINTNGLSISRRHSSIINIITMPFSDKIFFSICDKKLRWGIFEKTDDLKSSKVNIERSDRLSPVSDVIPEIKHKELDSKPIVLLRDQLDFSEIIEHIIDHNTGKVQFALPLINLPGFLMAPKVEFWYNGNNQVSGNLGIGWSFPQSYIMVERTSIFTDEYKYYLFLQEFPEELILDTNNSTKTILKFGILQRNKLDLTYYTEDERWELITDEMTQIYGKKNSSITWEIIWNNWLGPGSSLSGQKMIASAWYLTEIKQENNIISYDYTNFLIESSNKLNYTQDIMLKSISNTQGITIDFHYSEKTNDEYNKLPTNDKKGFFLFQKMNKHYLNGYQIDTPVFRQKINFLYQIENGVRFLKEINQDGDPVVNPICKFNYKKLESFMMDQMILPRNLIVNISYAVIPKRQTYQKRFDLPIKSRVDKSDEFVIISYIDQNGKVILKIFDQEMTEEIYSGESSCAKNKLSPIGRGLAKFHEVFTMQNVLALLIYHNTDKELCLLNELDKEWVIKPDCYDLNDETIVNFGKDFIVTSFNSTLEIFFWDEKTNEVVKQTFLTNRESNQVLIAVNNKIFALYDDNDLKIGHRNKDNKWELTTLVYEPNIVKNLGDVLAKFNLNEDTTNHLFNIFKKYMLQLQNNLLILSTWTINGNETNLVVNLFVVNNEFGIGKQNKIIIPQDRIDLIHFILEDDENIYKLSYKEKNGKYNIILVNYTGPVLDHVHNEERTYLNELLEFEKKSLNQAELTKGEMINTLIIQKTNKLNEIRNAKVDANLNLQKERMKLFDEIESKKYEYFRKGLTERDKTDVINEVQKAKNEVEEHLKTEKEKIYQDLQTAHENMMKEYEDALTKIDKSFDKNIMEINLIKQKRLREIQDTVDSMKKRVNEYMLKTVSNRTFLLDVNKYLLALNFNEVVGKNTKLLYDGNEWRKKTLSKDPKEDYSLKLNDKYILAKAKNKTSYNLYKQENEIEKLDKSLIDLETDNASEILIKYPVYIAWQKRSNKTSVIKFATNEEIDEVYELPYGEKLSIWSDYEMLVTTVSSYRNENDTTFIIRPQTGIAYLTPDAVVKQVTINYDKNMKRITGYEFNKPIVMGNSIWFENISILPGNEKLCFGWIEETKNFNNISQSETSFYDYNGRRLRTLHHKLENSVYEDNSNLFSLYDRSGNLQVAKFSPYTIIDEEVSYFGFEDYEVNKIGANKYWVFNEEGIVRNRYSFTGKNYLHLVQAALEGSFEPNNQKLKFVVSCWLKISGRLLKIGEIVPYLRATITSNDDHHIYGLLSEVKLKSADWFYLETIIDLPLAESVYKNMVSLEKITLNDEGNKLRILISVSPKSNQTIHVDHIRFFPLESDIQIKVYENGSTQPREKIFTNGLIKRYIYNIYQEQIAEINEYNQIEKINIMSKSIGLQFEKCFIQIKPNNGFYEDFSPTSFYQLWKIQKSSNWKVLPRSLYHFSKSLDTLSMNNYDIDSTSFGFRIDIDLIEKDSYFKFNEIKIIHGKDTQLLIFNKVWGIPTQCELLVIVEQTRLLVWINGNLMYDGYASVSLSNFEMSGYLKISDLMIFSDPSVVVTYFNSQNDKIQTVEMETLDSAIVTSYLYDKLGRQDITTGSIRLNRSQKSLLKYYATFITNDNPYHSKSVWKIGKLTGLIDEYNFKQTKYEKNPLNKILATGMPGIEFQVKGPYAKRFTSITDSVFINNHFPTPNFSYHIEIKKQTEDITIYDNKNNKVGWYFRVPGKKSLLSTYEYDKNGKQTKILSPLFHEKAKTFETITSEALDEKRKLEDILGIHKIYDDKGNLLSERTPDSEKIEYIYYEDAQRLFVLYYSKNEKVESTSYFNYDDLGRLSSIGKLKHNFPKEVLSNLTLTADNAEERQQFYYSDKEEFPLLRGKIKRTITYNDDEPFIEEIVLNVNKESISKRIIIPTEGKPSAIAINKIYSNGKLNGIEYPMEFRNKPLKIVYEYNKVGKVVKIGIQDFDLLANISYNAVGQVENEHFFPESDHGFVRKYGFESTGFINLIEDKFLKEKIYYKDESYDGESLGDGSVTKTEFKATWHEYSDNKKLGVNENSFITDTITKEQSQDCFEKLKNAGYINQQNHQVKIFYSENSVPIVCSYGVSGRQIKKILDSQGFPSTYGHVYSYGKYQELIAAKYFVGNEIPKPLQKNSFSKEINGVNITTSQNIFERLKKSYFLIESENWAKKGRSITNPSLSEILKGSRPNFYSYKMVLEKLLIETYTNKCNEQVKSNIKEKLKKILGESKETLENIENVVNLLNNKGYLRNPLSNDFTETMKQDENLYCDVVNILSNHFTQELGEAEFDIESYDIDANGNHKHFYTGSNRYEFKYNEHTNQIKNVNFKSFASHQPQRSFEMNYDGRGNVIRAMHKGIERIEYDPVFNKTTKIKMTDGRELSFYYDAKGERVLKRVKSSKGRITKEIHYIRDELGRCLIERQITFISNNLPPDVLLTAYIYGPRGLLGFIRKNQFYNVFTDHEYSVRLVIRNGEVVATYDYLPYGELMRKYGDDPDAHIAYRYTGQEYDEETNLYNYHARFYDPEIGRFYQMDPKEQYFSPYKYAGNSPISMVDPDGEFAFLIAFMVAFGIIGSYSGAAAANNNFNPLKWDWKSKTWLGLIGGAVGGALLPVGFVGSVGAIAPAFASLGTIAANTAAIGTIATLGLGTAYLNMAAVNNEWDPSKWDWKSPQTYNALLDGFGIGSGAYLGFKNVDAFYKSLGKTGKILFVSSSIGTGMGIFVINGIVSKWNYKKPGFYMGFMNTIAGATDLPMFARGALRLNLKMVKGFNKFKSTLLHPNIRLYTSQNKFSSKQLFREIGGYFKKLGNENFSKSGGKIFGGALAAGLFSGLSVSAAASEENDPIMISYAAINGIMAGGQLASMGKSFYITSKKQRITKNEIGKVESIQRKAQNYAKESILLYQKQIESGSSFGDLTLDIPTAARSTLESYQRNIKTDSYKMNIAKNIVELYSENFKQDPDIKQEMIIQSYTKMQQEQYIRVAKEVIESVNSRIADSISSNPNSRIIDIDTIAGNIISSYQRDPVQIKIADDTLKIYKNHFKENKGRLHFDEKIILNAFEKRIKNDLVTAQEVVQFCKTKFAIQDTFVNKFLPIEHPPNSNPKELSVLLPNRAISVAVTENYVAVTVSGTQAPGFVVLFSRTNPDIKYLLKNKLIDGKSVALTNDMELALKSATAEMKMRNTEKFRSTEKWNSIDSVLKTALSEYDISDRVSKKVSDSLHAKILTELTADDNPQHILKLSDEKRTKQIETILTKIYEDEDVNGIMSRKIAGIEKEKNRLKAQTKKTLNSSSLKSSFTKLPKEISRIIDFKEFEWFPSWTATNCAEPSAIHVLSTLHVNIEDVQFLATFKIPKTVPKKRQKLYNKKWNGGFSDFPDLEAFDRCLYCKVTTSAVDNVITDAQWLEKLKILQEKHSALKQKYFDKKLSFVAFYDVTERWINRIYYNDTLNGTLKRNKRSLAYRRSNNIHYNEYDYDIDNTKTKIKDTISKHASKLNQTHNLISIFSRPIQEEVIHNATNGTWFNKFSNYLYNRFSFGSIPSENNSNSSNLIFRQTDTNSTLLLFDVLVRKVTGVKYKNFKDTAVSYSETQAFALRIIDKFEKVLIETSEKCRVPLNEFDFYELYLGVTKILKEQNDAKLSNLLYVTATKLCPVIDGNEEFWSLFGKNIEMLVKEHFLE